MKYHHIDFCHTHAAAFRYREALERIEEIADGPAFGIAHKALTPKEHGDA